MSRFRNSSGDTSPGEGGGAPGTDDPGITAAAGLALASTSKRYFADLQGQGCQFRTLTEGQRVEFEVAAGEKGDQARNVRPL